MRLAVISAEWLVPAVDSRIERGRIKSGRRLAYDFSSVYYWQFICIADGNLSGAPGWPGRKERRHEGHTEQCGNGPECPQSRYSELKQMLDDRRREIQAEVQGKMRDVREEGTWGGKLNEVLDAVESSEADIQEDIEFALIQMKSETLNKINDALTRLEQGDYGNCFDCGEEIAEKRLRALPFAVRCKDCEEARENAEQRERQLAGRGAARARCSSTCNIRRPNNRGSAGGGAHLLPTGLPISLAFGSVIRNRINPFRCSIR